MGGDVPHALAHKRDLPQPQTPLAISIPIIDSVFCQLQDSDSTAIMTSVPGASVSKRRKFVADGVFYAELNEFFQRELAEEGYSGVEVRVTPTVTDISTSLSPYSLPVPLFSHADYLMKSSAQHTPKKSSASKGAASAN